MTSSRSLAALLGALLLLLCGAATAARADSIAITLGADPTEEVPLPVTVTWTATTTKSPQVMVTVKPAGPLGCGVNYAADDPNSESLVYSTYGNTLTDAKTTNWNGGRDPGSWILCGYLEEGGKTTSLAVTGPVPVTVRGARATVGITVPPRVDVARPYPLSVPTTTELTRRLFVTVKPVGGRACEPTYALDDPNSDTVIYDDTVTGTDTTSVTASALSKPGNYLLCAYVQEGSADTAPEATSQATFLVGPDPCVTAKGKLASATRAVRVAERSVTTNRKAHARYRRAARRAHGATRRRLQRKASVAHSRYVSAVRRRAKARATLGSAQAQVTSACKT